MKCEQNPKMTTAVHQVSFSDIATQHLYGIYTNAASQNTLRQLIHAKLQP